jgi:glutathione synthase/RimK-type ligase-like ATP-grasp enzyme
MARGPLAPDAPALPRPEWAVNNMADADHYTAALIWHDDWLGTSVPVFNHPRAIAQTRRDLSARRLSGVAGLVTPACVRFFADGVASFEATFARNGFRFPVLIRPCGEQGGKGQQRIDGPDGWTAAANSAWFRTPHFMTQYVETATAGGLYLKARVLLIGGQVFLRHIKADTQWQVHHEGGRQAPGFDELAVVERLEADPVFMALCAEIGRRSCLDYTGLDIGVDPDRQHYVLFECNPAMSVFFPLKPGETPERLARRVRLQTPAEEAVTALLEARDRWVSAHGSLATLPPVREALRDPILLHA